MDTLDLLLHPVRLRIVHAMSGGRVRTISELCAGLPDVSKATVYRQVELLVVGGLLEVAGEQRVHGAVERRYQLNPVRPAVDPARAGSMTLEEHRQGFVASLGALLAEFDTYLSRPQADPAADLVGYRQIPLWLSADQLATLIEEVRRIISLARENLPGPDRRLYLLSPILFPIDEPSRPASHG